MVRVVPPSGLVMRDGVYQTELNLGCLVTPHLIPSLPLWPRDVLVSRWRCMPVRGGALAGPPIVQRRGMGAS
jgi:hypothetical protein